MREPYLLIDAELYLYQAACAASYEVEWDRDTWTYMVWTDEAKAIVMNLIRRAQEIATCHRPVLVFGERAHFRYEVYPQYKSHRLKYLRPPGLKALRQQLQQHHCWAQVAGVEGDDALGLLAKEGDVILSQDKDLMTVPGFLIREEGDGSDKALVMREITQKQATLNFYRQAASGDAADGYPGIPKVGPVGAGRLFPEECYTGHELDLWDALVAAYAKAGQGPDQALAMARCAYILHREEDYDWDTGAPRLWQPPENHRPEPIAWS